LCLEVNFIAIFSSPLINDTFNNKWKAIDPANWHIANRYRVIQGLQRPRKGGRSVCMERIQRGSSSDLLPGFRVNLNTSTWLEPPRPDGNGQHLNAQAAVPTFIASIEKESVPLLCAVTTVFSRATGSFASGSPPCAEIIGTQIRRCFHFSKQLQDLHLLCQQVPTSLVPAKQLTQQYLHGRHRLELQLIHEPLKHFRLLTQVEHPLL